MENQDTDGQLAFIKELADIKQLKKEVQAQKKRLTALSGSLEQLQIMAFQEQLNNLSENVTKIETNLLNAKRFMAYLQIRVIHDETIEYVSNKTEIYTNFISELTAAYTKIKLSVEPLSIANSFQSKRWNDLQELGIKPLTISQ